MELDTGQWFILRKTYDSYLNYISPFVRCVLNNYFKTHTIDNRVVETEEELDALISLCEIFKQGKKFADLSKDEKIEIAAETQSNPSCEEEHYTRLIKLLELLSEQRVQYRLAQIRRGSKSQFITWV